jgi:hypothetical protein
MRIRIRNPESTTTGQGTLDRHRLTHHVSAAKLPAASCGGEGLDVEFVVDVVFKHFATASQRALDMPSNGGRGGGFGRRSQHGEKRRSEEGGAGDSGRAVKKLRPDEEKAWKDLEESGVPADLLRGLCAYCDRQKGNFEMFAEMDSKRIILEMCRLLDRKELGLALIRRELEKCGTDDGRKERKVQNALLEIFGEEDRGGRPKGTEWVVAIDIWLNSCSCVFANFAQLFSP